MNIRLPRMNQGIVKNSSPTSGSPKSTSGEIKTSQNNAGKARVVKSGGFSRTPKLISGLTGHESNQTGKVGDLSNKQPSKPGLSFSLPGRFV